MALIPHDTTPRPRVALREMSYFNHPQDAVLTQPECWQWTRQQPVTYVDNDDIGADFDSYMGYNFSRIRRLLLTIVLPKEYGSLEQIKKIEVTVKSWGNAPYYIPAWRLWWGVGLTINVENPLGWGEKRYAATDVIPETLADCPQPPYDYQDLTAVWGPIELQRLDTMVTLAQPYFLGSTFIGYKVPAFIALEDECYQRMPAAHVPSPLWNLLPEWRTPLWLNDMMFYPDISMVVWYSTRQVVPLAPGRTGTRGGLRGAGQKSWSRT